MTEFLGTYLRSIVLCALFLSLVELLIPEGPAARIAAFAGGLLLLMALAQPLLQLPGLALPALRELEGEITVRQDELTGETQAALAQRIAADTEAYICGMAQSLGLDTAVSVETAVMEAGAILPVAVRLTGPPSPALSQRLEEELGIPPERQVWHEGEN